MFTIFICNFLVLSQVLSTSIKFYALFVNVNERVPVCVLATYHWVIHWLRRLSSCLTIINHHCFGDSVRLWVCESVSLWDCDSVRQWVQWRLTSAHSVSAVLNPCHSSWLNSWQFSGQLILVWCYSATCTAAASYIFSSSHLKAFFKVKSIQL